MRRKLLPKALIPNLPKFLPISEQRRSEFGGRNDATLQIGCFAANARVVSGRAGEAHLEPGRSFNECVRKAGGPPDAAQASCGTEHRFHEGKGGNAKKDLYNHFEIKITK